MIKNDYKIVINKNENLFYHLTDRLNSYLMLHASDSKKSDGFVNGNETYFTDFYLKLGKKILRRTKADYTEVYSDKFIIHFNKYNLQLMVFLVRESGTIIFKLVNPGFNDISLVLLKHNEIVRTKSFDKTTSLFAFNGKENCNKSEEEINSMLNENSNYFEEVEKHLVFDFGNYSVNKALYWAQQSGLKLCAGAEGSRGIWAGLPWFRDNWGRDTFISMPGIFLVNGFFEEAKEVLHCFLLHQMKDPSSKNYGRIPNRYVNDEDVIYNTADGNLWFIKALWQYLQYSGDKEYLKEVWENVKLAVFSDLDLRSDVDGFLLNNDSDTWMDARIQGLAPLSARGNRANDIQALWFEALNIFILLSSIMNSTERVDEIKNVISKLKANFKNLFWDENKHLLADRIDVDGSKDFKIRPNQLFCVNAEFNLMDDEVERLVTKNSFEKLTMKHGVLSLSSEDVDFHPYHIDCNKYHKDAAYHNGAIWLWLSGPMISALSKYNWQDKAWELTKNHCEQMFALGCAGSLSENANAAFDKKGKMTPSGTWSQAWSVSEFTRTFYQDYLGIKPALLMNRLDFNPKTPSEWKSGSAKVLIGNDELNVSWTDEAEGKRVFTLVLAGKNIKELEICCAGKKYVLKPEERLNINVLIEHNDEKLEYAKLYPLKKYNCLKEKDYMFNKITKEYQGKFISGVN